MPDPIDRAAEAPRILGVLDELEALWRDGDSNDEGENIGNAIATLRAKLVATVSEGLCSGVTPGDRHKAWSALSELERRLTKGGA